jgi:hypothetical protein
VDTARIPWVALPANSWEVAAATATTAVRAATVARTRPASWSGSSRPACSRPVATSPRRHKTTTVDRRADNPTSKAASPVPSWEVSPTCLEESTAATAAATSRVRTTATRIQAAAPAAAVVIVGRHLPTTHPGPRVVPPVDTRVPPRRISLPSRTNTKDMAASKATSTLRRLPLVPEDRTTSPTLPLPDSQAMANTSSRTRKVLRSTRDSPADSAHTARTRNNSPQATALPNLEASTSSTLRRRVASISSTLHLPDSSNRRALVVITRSILEPLEASPHMADSLSTVAATHTLIRAHTTPLIRGKGWLAPRPVLDVWP